MIRVRFTMDEERKMLSFKIKGHADFKSFGDDPICAGASMLMYTLAQNVKYEDADGNSRRCKPEIRMKSGSATITVRAKDMDSYIRLSHLYCVIQTGYQLLAMNYPKCVVVTLFGEEDHSGI